MIFQNYVALHDIFLDGVIYHGDHSNFACRHVNMNYRNNGATVNHITDLYKTYHQLAVL